MKKYWWLTLLLAFALALPAVASQAVKISIDGTELKSDVPVQIIDGRTMVPLRAISEHFGKHVAWDGDSRTITINTAMTDLAKTEAIVSEWAVTEHNSLTVARTDPARNASCVRCHAGNGFLRHNTATPYDPKAEGADPPTTIDCATCHSGRGQELMHTGVIKGLAFASVETFQAGRGALCMYCHDGRRNPSALYARSKAGEFSSSKDFSLPHYGPAALVTGRGGMEIPGISYPRSQAHENLPDSCVSCHMPRTAQGYAQHAFTMDVTYIEQTCGSCHPGATTFNINGFQDEIKAMLEKMYSATVAAVPGAAEMIFAGCCGRLEFYDAQKNMIEVTKIPHEAYVAGYNYFLIAKADGSFGIHNPQYARSLLQESYKLLTGKDL